MLDFGVQDKQQKTCIFVLIFFKNKYSFGIQKLYNLNKVKLNFLYAG